MSKWLRALPALLPAAAALCFFGWAAPRAHQDLFTGVDSACYLLLAEEYRDAFSQGKWPQLTGRATAFDALPEAVRADVLYRPAAARKTADCTHQLLPTEGPDVVREVPFYPPIFPLSLAIFPALVPALAALFLCLLLCRAHLAGGLCGQLLALALFFASPYTAWFTRGAYPDVAAAYLAGIALLIYLPHNADAPERRGSRILRALGVGLTAGLAVSFHQTLAVFALPVLFLAALSPRRFSLPALLTAAVAGLLPLLLSTRFVCAPYGDFTRPAVLLAMLRGSADIRAVFAALVLSSAAGVAALCIARIPAARRRAQRLLTGTRPGRLAAAAGGPALLVLFTGALAALPPVRTALQRAGIDFIPLSLGLGILLLCSVVIPAVRRLLGRTAPAPDWLGPLFLLCTIPFFVILGQEAPTGLWGLRRAFPPLLLGMTAVLVPFLGRCHAPATTAGCAALCAGAALALFPVGAYTDVNGSGAHPESVWNRSVYGFREVIREQMLARGRQGKEPPLFLFDHFPAAIPFFRLPQPQGAADPAKPAVFAISDVTSKNLDWEHLLSWLSRETRRRPVYAVFSQPLEGPFVAGDLVFKKLNRETAAFRVRNGRCFAHARPTIETREFTFTKASIWREDSPAPDQPLILKPGLHAALGIEGPWAPLQRNKPGRWARRHAAFSAPLPSPGGNLKLRLEVLWTPPPDDPEASQTLILTPPWPAVPEKAVFTVPPTPDPDEPAVLEATFRRLPVSNPVPAGASFVLQSPTPYNPAEHGLKGYPPDLLVQVLRMEAETTQPQPITPPSP